MKTKQKKFCGTLKTNKYLVAKDLWPDHRSHHQIASETQYSSFKENELFKEIKITISKLIEIQVDSDNTPFEARFKVIC